MKRFRLIIQCHPAIEIADIFQNVLNTALMYFLSFQFGDLELRKRFGTSPIHTTIDLCFVNNLLVRRFTTGSSGPGVLTAADANSRTGEVITQTTTQCPHQDASIRACRIQGQGQSSSGSGGILEYCFECERFRIYDVSARKSIAVTCEDQRIRPYTMCKGPQNSLLIYDNARASIVEFTFNNSQLCYPRPVWSEDPLVKSICYNEHNGILAALSISRSGSAKITGINLATGHKLWHRCSVPNSRYVCSGNEAIFISGYGNDVTVLDAADGFYMGTILGNEHLGQIHKVVCSEEHDKLAALHENGQLTCYSLRKKHVH